MLYSNSLVILDKYSSPCIHLCIAMLRIKNSSSMEINFLVDFFTFSSYEKVLILHEILLSAFSSNYYVLRPPESEKTVVTKVSACL